MKHYVREEASTSDRPSRGSIVMRAREIQFSTVRPDALRDETAKDALGSRGTTATNATNAEA